MFKAKTSIKLLKQIGFVLIALPEPITTPFGAALVLTSQCLSRIYESDLNKHLQESLKRHLAYRKDARKPKQSAYLWRRRLDAFNSKPVPHSVDIETLSKRFGKNRGPVVAPVTSEEEKSAVQHVIDKETLTRRFKADDVSKVTPDSASPSTEKAPVLHPINHAALAKRFKTEEHSEPAESEKPGVMHRVNKAALSRRFQIDEIKTNESGQDSPGDKTIVHKRRFVKTDSQPSGSADTEPVVNLHRIDKAALARRFQIEEPKEAEAGANDSDEKTVIHRRVIARTDSQISESAEAEPAVNLHRIDRAALSRRFPTNEDKEAESGHTSSYKKTVIHRRVIARSDSKTSEQADTEPIVNLHRIDKAALSRRFQIDEHKDAESGQTSSKEKTVIRRRINARTDSAPSREEDAEPAGNVHRISQPILLSR